ncbi:arginase family protein [Actinoplanes sp. L3-i22]|uniref:arginase family protein n=1 Tax=Actinoplanes sp. L3-i22 TaxID=2836373 RepID=UPI0021025D7A|nr:arginase family protein [Actinoplanes sp. L3-i22]
MVEIPVRAEVTVAPEFPGGGAWRQVGALCEATAAAVAPVVAAGGVPVVFSGDCLVGGAVIAGVQRAGVDPAVVWFDGHGDVQTVETSTSGYLGGMSLRLATGAHPELYADAFGLRPLAPERAILVDARDLDPAEADYLATSPTGRITVAGVAASAVPEGKLVLHVDLDVIDPADLPGLKFPVPGGPSVDEVLAACALLVATGRVAAVHIACSWLPPTDEQQRAYREEVVARFADLV